MTKDQLIARVAQLEKLNDELLNAKDELPTTEVVSLVHPADVQAIIECLLGVADENKFNSSCYEKMIGLADSLMPLLEIGA